MSEEPLLLDRLFIGDRFDHATIP